MRGPKIEDVAGRVDEALRSLDLGSRVRAGERVAVTAGSRGIANIAIAVKATVDHLSGLGAAPFIVPAMGSHGGGTAQGQTDLLASFGITEDFCGCPIDARMDVVTLADSKLGFPILYAKSAAEADHVVVVNRVKTHTMFTGPVESGLAKMATIGLGKLEGAALYHRAMFELGWMDVINDAMPIVVERGNLLAGVALVERGDEQTARIEAIAGERILDLEPDLLADSLRWMATIPFTDIDLLLIDKIGKNISGTGLDPTVVGRKDALHHADPARDLRVRYIAARGLTEETHGNAVGVGFAEFCRSRILREMDVAVTRLERADRGRCSGRDGASRLRDRHRDPRRLARAHRAAVAVPSARHLDPQHARGRSDRLLGGTPRRGRAQRRRRSGQRLDGDADLRRRQPSRPAAARGLVAGTIVPQ